MHPSLSNCYDHFFLTLSKVTEKVFFAVNKPVYEHEHDPEIDHNLKKKQKSVCLGPKPYENGKLCAISQAGRLRIQKTTFSLSDNSIPLLLFPIQKTAKYPMAPHGTPTHRVLDREQSQ